MCIDKEMSKQRRRDSDGEAIQMFDDFRVPGGLRNESHSCKTTSLARLLAERKLVAKKNVGLK